jgi:HK97 family phage major capsid protein
MKNKKQLIEERNGLLSELNQISEAMTAEKRGFTEAESARVKEIDELRSKLDGQIEAMEIMERSKQLAPSFGAGSDGEEKELEKVYRNVSFLDVVKSLNSRSVSKEVEALNELGQEENRQSGNLPSANKGILIPTGYFRHLHDKQVEKRMNATTGSAGGYTVPTLVGNIVDFLKPRMILGEAGATFMGGLTGNIGFPVDSALAVASYNTETGDAANIDPSFSNLTMSPKRSAAYTDITWQLKQQASQDVSMWVMDKLLNAIAIGWERAAIKGGGSNEPVGILANSSVPVFYAGNAASNSTNANGAALVYQDILNLLASVEGADAFNLKYITNNKVKAKLMGTPVQTGGIEGNFIIDKMVTNVLAGFPALFSSNVPSNLTKGTSSTLSALIAGDFSHLLLGQWGAIELTLDNYTQALKGTDRIIVSAYTDALVDRPTAFALIKDAVA